MPTSLELVSLNTAPSEVLGVVSLWIFGGQNSAADVGLLWCLGTWRGVIRVFCVCALVCAQSLGCVWLSATLWTVAHQAPLSMGFSRQECWSGLPFPPPGDLPNPGIEPTSLTSPALAGGVFTTSATWEAQMRSKAMFLLWHLKSYHESVVTLGTSLWAEVLTRNGTQLW